MKIYSRQYMIRSYNKVNPLILYDNMVDNCQLVKYNLQDTFSLFRNSIMLFQLVKWKFQDAFYVISYCNHVKT